MANDSVRAAAELVFTADELIDVMATDITNWSVLYYLGGMGLTNRKLQNLKRKFYSSIRKYLREKLVIHQILKIEGKEL